jgi:hypothetical protein
MVAHYARADDGSPGVIRIGQLAERVVVALPRLCILRTTERPRRPSRSNSICRRHDRHSRWEFESGAARHVASVLSEQVGDETAAVAAMGACPASSWRARSYFKRQRYRPCGIPPARRV